MLPSYGRPRALGRIPGLLSDHTIRTCSRPGSIALAHYLVVKLTDPPTFREAFGPKTIPAGFIKNKLALPKPVVWMVPKIFEGLPPVTRPRIFEVGNAVSFKKLAMLLVGIPNSPKL